MKGGGQSRRGTASGRRPPHHGCFSAASYDSQVASGSERTEMRMYALVLTRHCSLFPSRLPRRGPGEGAMQIQAWRSVWSSSSFALDSLETVRLRDSPFPHWFLSINSSIFPCVSFMIFSNETYFFYRQKFIHNNLDMHNVYLIY